MSRKVFKIRLPSARSETETPEPRVPADWLASGDVPEALSRRRFLSLVSASAALAAGCAPNPPEKILPYTENPPDVTPGVSAYYATSLLLDGFATGLVATTREGRPLKIEGNPAHPASRGATSLWHQASILELYDPDRARSVTHRGLPSSWEALDALLTRPATDAGGRLRLLLEPTSSPLVHSLVAEVKRRFPESKVTFYAPLAGQAPGAATEAAFGERLAPQHHFERADVIVALDADFLSNPHWLGHARDFTARRRPGPTSGTMNRLYVAEPGVTITGSMADERLALPARRIAALAAALLDALGAGEVPREALLSLTSALDDGERQFVALLGAELRRTPRGATIIVTGERQPLEVHVLVHALNRALGNIGTTLTFTEQALPDAAGDQDLAGLVREMHAGDVETLLVLGGNPAYDAPADFDWQRAARAVPNLVVANLHANETAEGATWFAPLAHRYESWGDGRSYDGTWTLSQPLIRPLFGGRSLTELLARLAGQPELEDYERLRTTFGAAHGEHVDATASAAERLEARDPEVEREWRQLLARGFDPASAFPERKLEARAGAVAAAVTALATRDSGSGLELDFVPSPTLRDGRHANNAWLLELPAPVVKLSWDNAAFMSPQTASRLQLERVARGEPHPMIELERGGRKVRAPVVVVDCHADDVVTVWLGYGRSGGERLAAGVGFDAYRLRTSDAPYFSGNWRVQKLDETYELAFGQLELTDHERELAFTTTLANYRAHPDFTAPHKRPLPSILPEYRLSGPQWAMTIDLSACVGCSACVVACQAENNLLVVGKEQVRRGRSMHWLRIDTYRLGAARAGRAVHQPMMCQHCEDAPCEYVCPVNATVHSPDGLNEMVYNRCIGTRFCSNNCPYKVRRFNWFDWSEHEPANRGTVELQRNPEVSVRERGVMEKCTYCVQRIRAAEIRARIEHREIAAGEVTTACAQACPTEAIRFGSLTHRETPMVTSRDEARSYYALHETGARPRTMYLARVYDPNPERG